MDSHTYILRETLKDYSEFGIDEILKELFQKRSYTKVKTCHIVWNQILFFIFEDSIYNEMNHLFIDFYTIACIDVTHIFE